MRRITRRKIERVIYSVFLLVIGGLIQNSIPGTGRILSSTWSVFSSAVASRFCSYVAFPQKVVISYPSSFTWAVVFFFVAMFFILVYTVSKQEIKPDDNNTQIGAKDFVAMFFVVMSAIVVFVWIVFVNNVHTKYEEYRFADLPVAAVSVQKSAVFRYRIAQSKYVSEINQILDEMRDFSLKNPPVQVAGDDAHKNTVNSDAEIVPK